MASSLSAVKRSCLFCAVVGAVVFLAEFWTTLFVSPAFRQIVGDLPLLKLLRQTGLAGGAYLLASVLTGVLLLAGLRLCLRKTVPTSKLEIWVGRILSGGVLLVYASWAWRREMVPQTLPVLTAIVLGSILLPLLLRPSFFRNLAQGFALLLLCLWIFFSATPSRLWDRFAPKKALGLENHPNLLILSIDTLLVNHLSCYGYRDLKTPAIDRLAQEGCLFEQAITPTTHTSPSFCSIMTGLYPHTHGSRRNLSPLRKEAVTLAEVLRQQGYRTAAFVSGYPLHHARSGLHQGFDLYQDRFSFFEGFKLLRPLERLGWLNLQLERRAWAVDEIFLPWLRRHRKEPFFAWVHYFDPHAPYRPPLLPDERTPSVWKTRAAQNRQWWGVGEKAVTPETLQAMTFLYDREIRAVDQSIGRIVSFLNESALLDQTLVIVISDHGESFGHDYLFNHSNRLYDDIVRLALIFRYPPLLPKGRRYTAPVRSIDLFPTLLSLLKIPPSYPLEGKAIDFSRDEGIADIYLETPNEISLHPPPKRFKGVRSAEWKYILSLQDNREELYHLQKDPGETYNVVGTHPQEAQLLRQLLSDRMSQDTTRDVPPSKEEIRVLRSLGYLQ